MVERDNDTLDKSGQCDLKREHRARHLLSGCSVALKEFNSHIGYIEAVRKNRLPHSDLQHEPSPSLGNVLLLGIAQRQIHVSRTHIPVPRIRRKSLPTSIQTLDDLIQVKRYEKKLTLWRLAQKMGIATTSVREWEDGTGQPDGQQIALLMKHLGFALGERAHTLADAQL